MPGIASAQKMTAPHWTASDPDFSSMFYKPYEAAARKVLLLLDDTRKMLCRHTGRDCVRAMTFRLKTPASIREKLLKKGLPPSSAAASAALRDIAGLRAVLTDEEAVYRYAELICRSTVIEHLATNDYIACPKKSGYRSLHLLFRVPVCLHGQIMMVPAEIQLRTAAMDIWASIEHDICYKPIIHA